VETYLDGIVAWHRARAAADRRDLAELAEQAAAAGGIRPFGDALGNLGVHVIAEVKRRSPSKGDLAPDLDPAALARAYETGGAACLSVLTDAPHFAGSSRDLEQARTATELPTLRKDFTVSLADVYDARIMGADAVLLIAAVLSDEDLASFATAAAGLGMAPLIEVHDEAEVRRALDAGAEAGVGLIGVNQRDLHTFDVDTVRAVRVAASIPDGVTRVAESGIRGPADVEVLGAAGYDAVLVGETFVRASDPAGSVSALVEAGRARDRAGRS
jgi:indole-3-glycerol phosphate synthase